MDDDAVNAYLFFGRIIPERALLSVSEVSFGIDSSSDVPAGRLYIEIILSQVSARFLSEGDVTNVFSLRNLIEDATRQILDAVGYCYGYGYDLEIVQMLRSDHTDKQVFGIDIPALKGKVEGAGIGLPDVMKLWSHGDSQYFRHALADLREAIKSPRDTGFFCYRAVEALKNAHASRTGIADRASTWQAFREHYGIDKEEIDRIKKFADAARHADLGQGPGMSDTERAATFTATWNIVNSYILAERHAT
jgi:hypothetical protein